MVVWPLEVVPDPDVPQGVGERMFIWNRVHRQRPFHRPDEALDPAILPGAPGLRPLLADAEEAQPPCEPDRREHGFIVRPEELGTPILLHGVSQFLQQSH